MIQIPQPKRTDLRDAIRRQLDQSYRLAKLVIENQRRYPIMK